MWLGIIGFGDHVQREGLLSRFQTKRSVKDGGGKDSSRMAYLMWQSAQIAASCNYA